MAVVFGLLLLLESVLLLHFVYIIEYCGYVQSSSIAVL